MTSNQGDYGYTRDVIAAGRRIVAEIEKRAPDGVRWMVRTASATRMLPAQMQEVIARELLTVVQALAARSSEALAAAEEAVNTAGSPTALRQLADLLEATVAKPAGDLAPRVRSDGLEATDDEAWTGKAAGLYRKAIEGQGDAVGRISASAKELAKVCRDLAGHLDGFVVALTVSIVGLVGALMGVAVALSGLQSGGGSLLVLAGAVVVLIAGVGSFIATLVQHGIVLGGLISNATLSVQAWPNSRFGGRE